MKKSVNIIFSYWRTYPCLALAVVLVLLSRSNLIYIDPQLITQHELIYWPGRVIRPLHTDPITVFYFGSTQRPIWMHIKLDQPHHHGNFPKGW